MLLLMAVSGCMYPQDQTPGQNVSAREAVLTVQDAVDRYKDKTGLLPIQNADASVPLYEKYRVDFAKMQRMGYLSSIPHDAYENGGSHVFLIIDEETKPQVKLLDLAVYQGIDGIQKKADEYRAAHAGNNPAGDEACPGFRFVDFGKLGSSKPNLTSMYSHRPLELIMDGKGKVYGDYAIDIAEALKKTNIHPIPDEDLRQRLADASYFVPVKSPVYRWVSGAPQPADS
jgi:hypothetical protein